MTTFFTILSLILGGLVLFVPAYVREVEKTDRVLFESYLLYKYFSYIILIMGIICGVACGLLYKMPVFDYEYRAIKEGDLITYYVFNTPLMFYIWLCSVVLSLLFGAVSTHLKNQNRIITLLKKDSQKIGQTEQPEQKEQSEQQNSAEQKRSPAE